MKEVNMTEKKCILVDVDGTLANLEHRLGFIRTKPKNWKAFFNACIHDQPYEDIVWLVKTLKAAGNIILIVSARSENERDMTTQWLNTVAGLEGIYDKIYLREKNDYRDDSIVKEEILDKIYSDGYNPYMVLDDRDRVVQKWRSLGLRCLQVKNGDY